MLAADNLYVSYKKGRTSNKVLNGVSLNVECGETVCLTGPSGCGKTSLAMALMKLLVPDKGSISLNGIDYTKLRGSKAMEYFRSVQMVFQNPYDAFNPKRTLTWSFKETCTSANIGADWKDIIELLADDVDFPMELCNRYPDEVSGGELQRAAILRALIMRPRFLIMDEATTMLDLSTQAQIWNSIMRIKEEEKLGLLVITHDSNLTKAIGDRTLRMEGGLIFDSS